MLVTAVDHSQKDNHVSNQRFQVACKEELMQLVDLPLEQHRQFNVLPPAEGSNINKLRVAEDA